MVGPYLVNPDDLKNREIASGVKIGVTSSERIMPSFVEFTEGASLQVHSHPHEQAGVILEGEIEITMGTEVRILKAGEGYLIPGHVFHSVKALCPKRLLDIFSPPRNDYLQGGKFPR